MKLRSVRSHFRHLTAQVYIPKEKPLNTFAAKLELCRLNLVCEHCKVAEDAYRHHGFSSSLPPMMNVKNSFVFLHKLRNTTQGKSSAQQVSMG